MTVEQPDDGRRRDAWIAVAAAGLVFAVALPVARQGFSFLDDGIWLVGAKALLDGDLLYRDVFTIYGPARFVVLAAFFLVAGVSAATMALVEAVALAVAAATGTFAARRMGAGRWAWWVPVGLLALGVVKPKIVAAGLFAVVLGWAFRRGLHRGRAIPLGAFGGAVAWFGFDALVSVGMIAVLTVGFVWLRHGRDRAPVPDVALAGSVLVATACVPVLWAVATGSLNEFWWDAVVYPVAHFRQEMSISLAATLADGGLLGRPFATLDTGESLGARWPGHGPLRAAAIRLLAVVVLAAPVAGMVGAWRSRDTRLAALSAFALAGLVALITRGDQPHLFDAAVAAVWMSAVALARLPRRAVAGLAAVVVLAFGPLVAETLWLATNAGREGLQTWRRPRAGVALASGRVASLEQGFEPLTAERSTPTAFWPYQPGMNFVFDVPRAHPQITLLGGEVRDPKVLVDDLRRDPPPRVVLVQRFTLDGRTMRDLVPPLWGFLRTHYRVHDTITESTDPAWVLRPLPEGPASLERLPLDQRLPDKRASVADAVSPDLARGVRVAQSFRVDDRDLSGFRVRWAAGGTGFTARVDLVVWSVDEGRLVQPLRGFRIDVRFDQERRTSLFDLEPVDGTRGREIAVELRLPDGAPVPIRLLWHDHGGVDDRFPGGTAHVDGVPVDADLNFSSY